MQATFIKLIHKLLFDPSSDAQFFVAATGEKLNLSETYLNYWNYYDQIVAGEVTGGMVEEGGSWGEAADKIAKYGMIAEGDFIPPEADDIISKRQARWPSD